MLCWPKEGEIERKKKETEDERRKKRFIYVLTNGNSLKSIIKCANQPQSEMITVVFWTFFHICQKDDSFGSFHSATSLRINLCRYFMIFSFLRCQILNWDSLKYIPMACGHLTENLRKQVKIIFHYLEQIRDRFYCSFSMP